MTSGYVCTSCGAACAADTHEPKCRCGGLFELDFTPPAWDPARIDRSSATATSWPWTATSGAPSRWAKA